MGGGDARILQRVAVLFEKIVLFHRRHYLSILISLLFITVFTSVVFIALLWMHIWSLLLVRLTVPDNQSSYYTSLYKQFFLWWFSKLIKDNWKLLQLEFMTHLFYKEICKKSHLLRFSTGIALHATQQQFIQYICT